LSLVQRTFIIVNFLDVVEDGDDGVFEVAFFETRCDVMRMDALREVGFWFEGLYNSTEDQDISARIRQRGYKLLQDNGLEFGLDFGQTEDTFFKIFKKQFQYANGQAYIFIRYGLGHHLLSGGESNRKSRIWQRFFQIGLAPATLFLGVATIAGAGVGWLLIALLASRALYYWHRSRKTLRGVYRVLCAGTGVVCDLIYGSSFLSGLIMWALRRPGDVRLGRPVLEKRKNP
ncbi:MAG: glycosyltransferase, partial [Candidatus Binatia bacterium]